MEKNTKVYISVPITGHNIKAVNARIDTAKKRIERCRCIPISPLEISTNIDARYSEHMGRDIEVLLECDSVMFLRGWHKSRGCRLEFEAAKIYDKEIVFE